MAKRAAKTRNGGKWTESQFWSAIRSALRSKTRWWVPANNALLKARRPYKGPSKLAKWQFQCCECNEWYLRKDVAIDHKTPCGSLNKPEDLAPFIERLTPENEDAFQVLCKKCHHKKTQAERKCRRVNG